MFRIAAVNFHCPDAARAFEREQMIERHPAAAVNTDALRVLARKQPKADAAASGGAERHRARITNRLFVDLADYNREQPRVVGAMEHIPRMLAIGIMLHAFGMFDQLGVF